MPGNYAKVTWVMQESLRSLLNRLEVATYFNTDLSKEYKKGFAVGDTIYPKLPQRFTIRDGMSYTPQAIDRKTTTVTMDQFFGVDFDYDSVEKMLEMERGEELVKSEYIDKAVEQLAQELDQRCANFAMMNCPNQVGNHGATPATINPYSDARARLVSLACGGDKNGMIISPSMHATLGQNLTLLLNPQKEISDLFRTGLMGNAFGFNWHESMSIYDFQAGTMTVADCTVTTTVTTQGATSLGITSNAAAVALKKGDVITFTTPLAVNPATRRSIGVAKSVVLTQDTTIAAGGGTGTVYFYPPLYGPGSPYQNIDQLPQAGHVLLLSPGTTTATGAHGVIGLAINRDAFALVSVPLEEPKAVEISKTVRDPRTGISISLVRQFEGRTRTYINRLDILCGFGRLYAENCCVRVASLL